MSNEPDAPHTPFAPPAATEAVILAEHVAKVFPMPAPSDELRELRVLTDVSLALAPGESVAIMGPSGTGKSTLLNVLGTLDAPSAGTVHLAGVDPYSLSERELAAFRNARLGFVFQDHHLLPQCSLLENVLIPGLAAPEGVTDEFQERARALVSRMGLGDRLAHRPAQLSGGERQRVAIVRALVNRPQVVLADEPTGNLDEALADELAAMFREIAHDEQTALIVATHSAALARHFDRVYRLTEGRLEEQPKP